MSGGDVYVNPRRRPVGGSPADDIGDPLAFHRSMPGYAPTRLARLERLRRDLHLGDLRVKDESSRLGLPSFKILGGAWAVHRLLLSRAGRPLAGTGFADLRDAVSTLGPLTLCTATDGNHGRGVAHMARLLGLDAVVYVPDDTAQARIEAIRAEGATVHVHPGDYDGAVAAAAAAAETHGWDVVADVAYDDDAEVPAWVIDGYDTIFAECDGQWADGPTTVFVQSGVGALAGAAVRHYRRAGRQLRFGIVEPTTAACLLASARAGAPVSLESSQGSIMAGLNCGTPSTVAWPRVVESADVFLAVDDDRAREAMRLLAAEGIVAGESGAAGLAGLLEAVEHPSARTALELGPTARVLLVNTEGATDPRAYEAVVGAAPRAVAG